MKTASPNPDVRSMAQARFQQAKQYPRPEIRAIAAVLLIFTFSSAAAADAEKRVEINKTTQVMRAYEGSELVFETRVSTGRTGHETPNGSFRAGEKHRMHYSRRYHNAPMPYSVQVHGNYFIHGFKEVPGWPASHGCIRVPLDGANPASWFYQWVETGTPITIAGHWEGNRRLTEIRNLRAIAPAAVRPRSSIFKSITTMP